MTQQFPRQHIAEQISEFNQIVGRASDLQIGLYGLVSMVNDNPDLKVIALQAAEAIDLLRDLAKGRAGALRDMKTVAAVIEKGEEAA